MMVGTFIKTGVAVSGELLNDGGTFMSRDGLAQMMYKMQTGQSPCLSIKTPGLINALRRVFKRGGYHTEWTLEYLAWLKRA